MIVQRRAGPVTTLRRIAVILVSFSPRSSRRYVGRVGNKNLLFLELSDELVAELYEITQNLQSFTQFGIERPGSMLLKAQQCELDESIVLEGPEIHSGRRSTATCMKRFTMAIGQPSRCRSSAI